MKKNNTNNNNNTISTNDNLPDVKISDNKKKNSGKILGFIRIVIFIAALIVFCYSAGMLFSIFLEYKKGDDIYNKVEKEVLNNDETCVVKNEEKEEELPFVYNFNSLKSLNSDSQGFIYIPSINIKYPIVVSDNNDYYLNHTFDKQLNDAGCIFIDYRITDRLNSSNIILHGHNRKNNSMFGKLPKYESKDFFNKTGNDIFYIYKENTVCQYRIFSVHICDPIDETYSYNFNSNNSLQEYANKMKTLSIYDTETDISDITQIVTLSTCTDDTTQRFIVQGKLIEEFSLNN